ncbi:MAG: hypothetical protein KC413_08820 [Anaerolineales bacterium]|nr:hypothetical protein [Anaerolineales bacterium]
MNKQYFAQIVIVTCLIFIVASGIVLAQSSGTFDLRKQTIDGGGGFSSGGPFVVRGTAGQTDAGTVEGGTFKINSGFWYSSGPNIVYLPIVLQ